MARLRTIMTFAAVLAVAILILGAIGLWTGVHRIAPNTGLTDLVGLFQRGPNSLGSKIDHNQRINVLLMARGGAGHDNPDFSDTMLLLSIHPGSRQAVLVSLPRFLLVNIPALTGGDVSGRLYSAYAIGAKTDTPKLRSRWKTATGPGDLAAATVAGLTQLPIDYWIAIDIAGFRTIVDALGGIDITVPTPLDDPSYPVGETERRIHIHFDAGKQRMDGDQALEYARSRLSTSEGDRSARQELVVLAIMQRLHGVNAGPQLLPLLGALQ